MDKQLPPPPKFPAKPLQNAAAEADAQLIADAWKARGADAAVNALFMWQWLHEPVVWEIHAMRDRVRTIAAT